MPPKTNNVWRDSPAADVVEFITLPSGQTCHARRIGLESILATGLLGDADSLTAYVDQKHVRRVHGDSQVDVAAVAKDPKALQAIVMLVDRATPFIVTDPVVYCHIEDLPDGKTRNIPVEERKKGEIYTDQVPLEDKMFLLNYGMGGTRDAQRFLGESADAVAGVVDVTDVPSQASQHSRSRRKRTPRR